MAKTETNVSTLKINRGTYAKVQENLSSIGENELIITSDKNVPIPTTNDNGKAVVVNTSGEYELGTIPTPHTINTYTTGTLSEADQAKILEDIAQGYPIKVGNLVYSLQCNVQYWTYWISRTAEQNTRGSYNLCAYNKTNHTLSIETTTDAILFSLDTLASLSIVNGLTINGSTRKFATDSISYLTTAPTADNTSGYLGIVKLTSEPAQRYNGWWYIILSSTT